MRGAKAAGHLPSVPAGTWLDAARWLALGEAIRWAEASWQAQAAASWQLGKTMRFLMRDSDDARARW